MGTSDDSADLRASLTDPARFAGVFERHHRVIWTYVARLAGPRHADDIAGQVFTEAFAQRDRFDPDRGEVRSWLYGIASNQLRSTLRSEVRANRAFARAVERDGPSAGQEWVEDVDELTRTNAAVRKAMEALGRDDREILALYAWEERSYDQIAESLGVATGTVKSRLSRARTRLRELMAANDQPSAATSSREAT